MLFLPWDDSEVFRNKSRCKAIKQRQWILLDGQCMAKFLFYFVIGNNSVKLDHQQNDEIRLQKRFWDIISFALSPTPPPPKKY